MKNIIKIFVFLLLFVLEINAQENKIIGEWQLTTVETDGKILDGFKTVFIFAEKGILKASRSITSQAMEVGSWNYDKNQNSIIMESEVDRDFNGTATQVIVNKNTLIYKHHDALLTFTKTEIAKPNNEPIPELYYTEDDFWIDDEFKYPMDSDKLPWDVEALYSYMATVSEIIYTVDQYKENFGKIDSWVSSYKISFNEEHVLSIREYSYFHEAYIDMSDNYFPLNEENKKIKVFYPRAEIDTYRVIGEEVIKTAIGEFNCTVVEGIGDFEKKLKFWMINDKPGVYAKINIIIDEGNPFDYNKEYTLKEIK